MPSVDDLATVRIKKVLEKAGLGFTMQDALEYPKARSDLISYSIFRLLHEFAQKAERSCTQQADPHGKRNGAFGFNGNNGF